ncbi:hypothetical protein DPEC_G00142950 [Dallia pectoralis]|uniref:Uncharacterized protein n=1 Tax=Dallia pectoralis TaxID=75939 RepID=A0ACC2GN71_DALPE|nr:hypothetical protein DPEC_G00142950 [Dallia pectoralis]
MRPLNSITFEPGMERCVPWGRDLFTFVTSAAGHMMRTLQRPKKNRPSKRQVNHRRFLHNMIQRKFAEIEAANHQIASVLFSTDVVNSDATLPSQHPIMTDQSNSPSEASRSADPLSPCSTETRNLGVEHNEPGDQLSLNLKQHMDQSNCSTPSEGTYRLGGRTDNQTNCRSPRASEKTKNLEQGGEHFHTEPFGCEMSSEEGVCSWIDGIREKYETQVRQDSNSNTTLPSLNPRALPGDMSAINLTPLSPGLSHLSLDSCDFAGTTATDISACYQSQNNMADHDATVESQRPDMLRLWDSELEPLEHGRVGDFVEPDLESVWGSQGEDGSQTPEVHGDDSAFLNQSDSFIEKLMVYTASSSRDSGSEMELIGCFTGQCDYGHGYRCSVDPVSAIRDFLNGPSSSQALLESALGIHASDRQRSCLNAPPNQFYSSFHCNRSDAIMLQSSCPQPDSTFSLAKDDLNQSYIPFAGVARSFPAPTQTPHSHQVLTPPLENDWLFTDIMEDGGLPV